MNRVKQNNNKDFKIIITKNLSAIGIKRKPHRPSLLGVIISLLSAVQSFLSNKISYSNHEVSDPRGTLIRKTFPPVWHLIITLDGGCLQNH